MSIDTRWVCARTKYRSEMEAAANLEHQKFEVYVPRYQRRISHARRTEIVSRPLFNQYIFVAINSNQRLHDISTTPYVDHLVRCGDQPAIVGDDDIATLRSREENGFIKLDAPPPLRTGDKIKVIDGIFESFFGKLESMTDDERVEILLDVLGRKTPVTLNANLIVRENPAPTAGKSRI